MHERSKPSRAQLQKARWQNQISQTTKGLGHFERGIARFLKRRPVVSSFVLVSCLVLAWQAFGGRS